MASENLTSTVERLFWTNVYAVALLLNYHFVASGYFDHFGISYYPLSFLAVFFFLSFFSLIALALPSRIEKPSDFVTHFLCIVLVCPASLIILTSQAAASVASVVHILFIAAGILGIAAITRIPRGTFPAFEAQPGWILFSLLAAFVACHGLLFASFGFSMPANVLEVYEVRLQARDVLAQGPPGLGYILRWSANALNPCIFLVGLIRRNWLLVLFALAGQTAIYSFDGTKVTLFSLVFVFVAWFLVTKAGRRSSMLYAGAAFMLAALPILDNLSGIEVTNFLFNRRIFFMPAVASLLYFETFSMSEAFFWSGSFLSGLVERPVDYSSPAFFVGSLHFGSNVVSANANFLSAAYANAGYFGIAFITLVSGVVLWIYDSVTKSSGLLIAVPLIAVPAFAMSNSAFPSVLSTHGLFLSLVLAFIIRPLAARDGANT